MFFKVRFASNINVFIGNIFFIERFNKNVFNNSKLQNNFIKKKKIL